MSLRISLQSIYQISSLRLRSGCFAVVVSILVTGPAGFTAGAEKNNLAQVISEAETWQKKGDLEKATQVLWDHVKQLDRTGFLLLIHLNEAKKDWPEVVRAANLFVAKTPNDEEVLTALGVAQHRRGKIAEAKNALKKAIDINKSYQPAYEALSKVYEKNLFEQRLLYQDMIEVFGPKAEFLSKLCWISRSDGDNEQGLQLCTQAIAKDPENAENHVNLAIITKQKGDGEKAGQLLKEAAKHFPKSESAQLEAAIFYEDAKNYVDAYSYFEACLKISEGSERCMIGAGNSGLQLQKFARAYELFKQLCRQAGRKNSAAVRKAAQSVRLAKSGDWTSKFEDLSDHCAFQ